MAGVARTKSRRCWTIGATALLVAVALTSCSARGSGSAVPGPSPSASSTSPTSPPVTTPSPLATPTDDPVPPGPHGVQLTLPPTGVAATGPTVVLVHGGAWVAGEPALMDRWATALAATGAVVFNASYRLVFQGGGYPTSVDDVACAVRYARATVAADSLTTSDQLVIMGHSAGGHLAAVVALNEDAFGAGCPYPRSAPPDRLVGLAGIYDVSTFVLFGGFVGASRDDAPAEWRAVDPVELTEQRSDLEVTLVVGNDDELVPEGQARSFAAVLPPDQVRVNVVPGAGHDDLLDPDVVGLKTVGF